MTATRFSGLEARHVNALLGLLDEHAQQFLAADDGTARRWRLYFVDADLLSVYVNGRTRDAANEWSSLLSLVDGRTDEVSDEVARLASTTGQAVVRYIFGALLKEAEHQRGRVYITPEHEREFKSIVRAVMRADAGDGAGTEALRQAYLELMDTERMLDASMRAAHEIVTMLEERAASNASDRAYALLTDAISRLSTNLITIPAARSEILFFAADDSVYLQLVEQARAMVWEAFESSLKAHSALPRELFVLKRAVFDWHDAAGGAERPFSYFADRFSAWLATPQAPRELSGRDDLAVRLRVAVREAADLSALVRIVALRQWLDERRPPAEGATWETVLITGSGMLRRTVRALPQARGAALTTVLHPLAMLRHVGLWDPAGASRLREAGYLDEPHEFALSRIFGSGPRTISEQADRRELVDFIQSLQDQLELVVSRDAVAGSDRSYRGLRAALQDAAGFDRNRFVETLRDLVAQRYAQTFNRLVELFPGDVAQLPASSLPSLDLTRSPSAMDFLKSVRHMLEGGRNPEPFRQLEACLREDRSAYSALLALAIGYMARGQQWLPQAQSMAATATLLAKGRRPTDGYPDGNEALYMEAFLLRMNLAVGPQGGDFAARHHDLIAAARATLDRWRTRNAAEAEQPVGRHASAPSRVAWIDFRYQLEANAGEIFVVLAGYLQHRRFDGVDLESLQTLAERSLELHEAGARMAASNALVEWPEHYEPSIWFNGIQAGLCTLQSWLLWREAATQRGLDSPSLARFEQRIEQKVADLYAHRRKLGKLLPLLAKVYARKTGRCPAWDKAGLPGGSYARIKFAGIDSARMGWLTGLLNN